jgi:3-oxoadipate enol-lactonase
MCRHHLTCFQRSSSADMHAADMILQHNDALLATVDIGPDDRPLIALNGWSASWQAWLPTFELLSRTRRCLSYDTRGTGGSFADPSSITLTNLIDDVFRVLDAHGIDRCTLAGESLGGFVAMHAVARDPGRFTDLVLVATTPAVPRESVGERIDGARRDYPATVREFTKQCLNEPDSTMWHHWGESLFLLADPEVAARLFECAFDYPVDPAAVTVPTTVVHGDADLVVPIDIGRFLARAIPSATLVELPGVGHAPTVVRPREVAAAFH